MTSAASATAPLPYGVRAVEDLGLKGGGGNDGRRALMTLAASDTASLLEGARAVDDVSLKGGDDGRRACDDVGRQQHGASPGGDKGG